MRVPAASESKKGSATTAMPERPKPSAAPSMPFILALAAGTLIYVTSNEIIPESHSHGFEGTASSGVVTGFLLTLILKAVLH